MAEHNWIDLAQDAETGIETIRAHFEGHAYDPHWHDSYLIGFTEQGTQQFNCRRSRHDSTPGLVFTLNPGELHDGTAPAPGGFTYSGLYLEPRWLERELHALFEETPGNRQLEFPATLTDDPPLVLAIAGAFRMLSWQEMRIVRQTALDELLRRLVGHLHWTPRLDPDPRLPLAARRGRDYLVANMCRDVGLDELARVCSVDRFRLTRAFKAAFGLAPHAYLILLRLAKARHLLARGEAPADVATALGFSDQSHMGRWFCRVYRLTPAQYSKRCSNFPD